MKVKTAKRSLRPTSSKVREALFNILREKVPGSGFLDLYAGTGAVGIEALRQGASSVVFVEAGRISADKIESTLKRLDNVERARIIRKKAVPFIHWAEERGMTFHIIFLDPPYHSDEITRALKAIDHSSLVTEKGIVIAEHFSKRHLPDRFDKLEKIKDYKYGDTVLSLYGHR
jgi:16S rRNA (guanine(966)-N(2))-methyltransferase RsmD